MSRVQLSARVHGLDCVIALSWVGNARQFSPNAAYCTIFPSAAQGGILKNFFRGTFPTLLLPKPPLSRGPFPRLKKPPFRTPKKGVFGPPKRGFFGGQKGGFLTAAVLVPFFIKSETNFPQQFFDPPVPSTPHPTKPLFMNCGLSHAHPHSLFMKCECSHAHPTFTFHEM